MLADLKDEFVTLIDEHFPKGKSKERGQAMVCMAQALMAAQARQDDLKKQSYKQGWNDCFDEFTEPRMGVIAPEVEKRKKLDLRRHGLKERIDQLYQLLDDRANRRTNSGIRIGDIKQVIADLEAQLATVDKEIKG
jgi:hypothetical protein